MFFMIRSNLCCILIIKIVKVLGKIKSVIINENILNYNTTPRKSLGWHTPLELFKTNLTLVALRLECGEQHTFIKFFLLSLNP